MTLELRQGYDKFYMIRKFNRNIHNRFMLFQCTEQYIFHYKYNHPHQIHLNYFYHHYDDTTYTSMGYI